MVFSVHLGWLPPNGRGETVMVLGVPVSFLTLDGLAHIAMPALNLALFKLSPHPPSRGRERGRRRCRTT